MQTEQAEVDQSHIYYTWFNWLHFIEQAMR